MVLNPLKIGLNFFMFKPDNSTITRNMHKVALQNYATGLPHQRGQKWQGSCLLDHKHAGLATSPNPARICPFCEGKRKSSDSLAGIYMKQAPGGLGTLYLLFCQEPHHSLHASASWRAHHPPPSILFFGYAKKP